MYKLNQLPESYPYSQTGRVYLKAATKKFYEYIKTKINKPPDWLTEWEPGMFIRMNIQLIFKDKQHGDPTNYLVALLNGVVHAIHKWKESFDDKWIIVNMKVPMFGKKEGILFDMEVASGEEG